MKQLTVAIALMVSGAALAQLGARTPDEPGYTVPRTGDSAAPRRMEQGQSFRGEVQAVDKASGTITLKHDSISVLGVPARTSDYAVKDSSIGYERILDLLLARGYDGYVAIEYVWIDWEHMNECDNVSETVLLRDRLRGHLEAAAA